MKKAFLIFICSLPMAGTAFAQCDPAVDKICVSTDPVVAAQVERLVQQIIASNQQQQTTSSGASGTAGSSATSDGATSKPQKARKGKAARPNTNKAGDKATGT
jgi:hypothetical protein